MILHGLDTSILDSADKRKLDMFCERYNDSMNTPLPVVLTPYFDEVAFEQDLEATQLDFIERLKQRYINREFVANNLINKENHEKVKYAVRWIDTGINLSEGSYIWAAKELDKLGEDKIIDYYNLRPFIDMELPKPVYAEGYEPDGNNSEDYCSDISEHSIF